MVHLLSALIVGSVYSGGYSLRGKKLNLYKLSVVTLLILVAAAIGSFLVEGSISGTMDYSSWSIFLYAREVIVYSLWLQSLICAALSIASFITARHWRYLAGSVFFGIIFIALAFATSNQAIALPFN